MLKSNLSRQSIRHLHGNTLTDTLRLGWHLCHHSGIRFSSTNWIDSRIFSWHLKHLFDFLFSVTHITWIITYLLEFKNKNQSNLVETLYPSIGPRVSPSRRNITASIWPFASRFRLRKEELSTRRWIWVTSQSSSTSRVLFISSILNLSAVLQVQGQEPRTVSVFHIIRASALPPRCAEDAVSTLCVQCH